MPSPFTMRLSTRARAIALAALMMVSPDAIWAQRSGAPPLRSLRSNVPAARSAGVGDRTVLDANLGLGTGGQNAIRPTTDYNARNLIVTGDVAGGRGFRGFVGYTAVGDFSAPTGADDLFRERAISAGTGIPSLDLLRSPNPMAAGQQMGMIEQYRRSFFVDPVNQATGNPVTKPNAPTRLGIRGPIYGDNPDNLLLYMDQQIRLDQILAQAASGANRDGGHEPTFLGFVDSPQGQTLGTDASALRGLRYTPREWLTAGTGLTTLDVVRALEDLHFNRTEKPMIGQPFEPKPFNSTDNPEPVKPEPTPPLENRLPSGAKSGPSETQPVDSMAAYQSIRSEVVNRYRQYDDVKFDGDPRLREQLQQDFSNLRKSLNRLDRNSLDDPSRRGLDPTDPTDDWFPDVPGSSSTTTPSPAPRGIDGLSTPSQLGQTGKPSLTELPDPLKRIRSTELNDPADLAKPRTSTVRERLEEMRRRTGERDAVATVPSPLDVRDFGEVLRHGKKIEHLSDGDQTRFNELMVEAEQKMAEGEYFPAERRFTRALRYTPGHPYAIAGVMNAQLGAGLYLSASLSMRMLFTNYPEMIDVAYRGDLLPKRPQLTKAIDDLRAKLTNPKSLPEDLPAFGMLMAYFGHQIDDAAVVREGLLAMREHSVGDPLVTLLESVWLGEDKPAASAVDPSRPQQPAALEPAQPTPPADDSK